MFNLICKLEMLLLLTCLSSNRLNKEKLTCAVTWE